MLAFLNDPKVKDKYLTRVVMHREADEIVKGQYWEGGKGCAVGCTIHSRNHADYETELGIPRILARLEDGIFEALPNELAKTWPERFLSSINTGANLEMVWSKFVVWLLGNTEHGIIKFAKSDKSKPAIQTVIDLYNEKLNGKKVELKDWQLAKTATYADDAYADATYAHAAHAAAYASAAHAATYAAASAARAATYTDDAAAAHAHAAHAATYDAHAAARTRSGIRQSEKLLEILSNTK